MSVSLNVHGKTPYMCSCGIAANLEAHELPDWLARHQAHYAGIEHNPKVIGPPHQPDSVVGMVNALFAATKQQTDDAKDQLRLMIQKEISNALPNKGDKR